MTDFERARDFIVVWTRSESIEQVAEAVGKSKASVSQYASKLRKQGVKIVPFQRKGLDSLQIAQLNSMVAKAREEA